MYELFSFLLIKVDFRDKETLLSLVFAEMCFVTYSKEVIHFDLMQYSHICFSGDEAILLNWKRSSGNILVH